MWPWEHALVAYVLYSILSRSIRRQPPGEGATLLVLVGSVLPDLIDKPLAWGLDVLPAGRSLAHSLVFAIPLIVLVVLVVRRRRRTDLGIAFGLGYLSHLAGDVVYPALVGEAVEATFLLYPFVPIESDPGPGFTAQVMEFFAEFLVFLGTSRGLLYLGGEVVLGVLALWLWIADGKPGLGVFRRGQAAAG